MNATIHARPAARFAALPVLLLLLAVPAATRGDEMRTLRSEQAPSFSADLNVTVDPDGTPGLALTVTLGYPELSWVKADAGYAARFEVMVVFLPDHDKTEYGDAWQRQVRAETFQQTSTFGTTVVERRTFHVPPGKYRLRVRVQDLNSNLTSTATERVEVPDYSKVPLTIAELELGVMAAPDSFVAVPSRAFGYDSDRMAARVSVIDRRAGEWPRQYTARYRILDDSGQELARGERPVTLNHAAESAIVRPDSAAWFVGSYTFALELESGKSRWKTERSFEVEESGPPRGAEYKRMLEPLAYVAEAKEIDVLTKAPEAQQAAEWEAFWKKRDPTPETPRNEALIEFLRRVRYSEQHFQHFGPGWRSDMGRIYIKFGAPDQVESRPATLQSPPVEVWYYNRPSRQFVFADREGFGRYVLVSPASE